MAEEGYLNGGVEGDFLVVNEIEQIRGELGEANVALDSSTTLTSFSAN